MSDRSRRSGEASRDSSRGSLDPGEVSGDYEAVRATYDLDVPERFNFARDVLDELAEDPDLLALWWVGERNGEPRPGTGGVGADRAPTGDAGGRRPEVRLTFRELARRSRQVANVLADLGVTRGDVVVVMLPRIVEWWVVNMACLRLGAILGPATVQLSGEDVRFRLRQSGAVCVIADVARAPRIDAVIEECPGVEGRLLVGGRRDGWASYDELVPGASDEFETVDTRSDESALLYFTSGTTGHPKMTVHSHVSYPLRHKLTGELWLDLHRGDLHWNLSDTGWAKAGWSSVYGPWNQGATVFVYGGERFDSETTLELLSTYPVAVMCAAPTVYRMLVLEDLAAHDFRALRHCVAAGEPLNPEVMEDWEKHTGIVIRDGYGQTETSLLVGSFPFLEPRPGSMGKPAPGFDIEIIDADGNVRPDGEEGDLAVRVVPERPVGLFKEYWKDPERTADTFRGDWYITGDRAYRDDDGYLWFVGRSDDVVISSGYRIGPFEIESALLEHEAVAESAVVASPDEVRGEVVKAFIVLRPGYEPSDDLIRAIQETVKEHTAPYKYPRKVAFVDELPKTVSGKIRRKELREREWEGRSRGRSPG